MKIAIVSIWVPFYRGGAEILADAVYQKLKEAGHDVTHYRFPFNWNPTEKIIECLLALNSLRFDHFEKVIAFKFPAYCINHPNKTVWLFHQFRQAYDFWGTPYQGIPNTPAGLQLRHAIFSADNLHLNNAKAIYCLSPVTADRLQKFNGISAKILYHPLPDDTIFRIGQYGDYIFYPSRINESKRQALITEAMRFVRSPVKLILAGLPETAQDLEKINCIIKNNQLHDKVIVYDRFITEEEKVELLANALAITYFPYDEDSYGYVTLEAYLSRKPIITCVDSGGTHLLVKNKFSGLVTDPEPRSIAEAIDTLYYSSKTELEAMGEYGYSLSQKLKINWNTVVEELTK